MDKPLIMIYGYYFFLVAGLFYLFFIRPGLSKDERKEINKKVSCLKRIIGFFNSIAEHIGRISVRLVSKKSFTINRRILDVLEYEKDIRITPSAFVGYRIIMAILLFTVGIVLGGSLVSRILFSIIGAITGYLIPFIMIRRYSAKVSKDIEKELAYVIDLLRVSSLSGQNIYNSFKMLTEKYNGRICNDLKSFIRDIDMGVGKEHAYRNLILASRSEQFREFISILREADKYGSPVNKILSSRSIQVNNENWDNAEKMAKKKGLLTLLPLAFLILPAFILLVGGPLVFSMASNMFF